MSSHLFLSLCVFPCICVSLCFCVSCFCLTLHVACVQALRQTFSMSRFMCLYMELRKHRFIEEFVGTVEGTDRRCIRLWAQPANVEKYVFHRRSDVWHVSTCLSHGCFGEERGVSRRPDIVFVCAQVMTLLAEESKAITMAEIMERLDMNQSKTRVEIIRM